jgi:hypothetical protein
MEPAFDDISDCNSQVKFNIKIFQEEDRAAPPLTVSASEG